MDGGPHMRTPRGRRRIWRAASSGRGRGRDEGGERQTRQRNGNTLHLVIHLPATTTAYACSDDVRDVTLHKGTELEVAIGSSAVVQAATFTGDLLLIARHSCVNGLEIVRGVVTMLSNATHPTA